MNPETNRFEPLKRSAEDDEKQFQQQRDEVFTHLQGELDRLQGGLLRPDGTPVPQNWSVFTAGEHVVLKNYTYRVAYINESSITLEPVGPVVIDAPPRPTR